MFVSFNLRICLVLACIFNCYCSEKARLDWKSRDYIWHPKVWYGISFIQRRTIVAATVGPGGPILAVKTGLSDRFWLVAKTGTPDQFGNQTAKVGPGGYSLAKSTVHFLQSAARCSCLLELTDRRRGIIYIPLHLRSLGGVRSTQH